MSAGDIGLLVGQLVSAWAIGFVGGYTITQFVRAMNSVV